MARSPLPRPQRPPGRQQRNQSPVPLPRPTPSGGGNRGGRNRGGDGGGGGSRGGGPPDEPSPWLTDQVPPTSHRAGFVEYLRWMRAADRPQKDGTKVQLMQLAVDRADYRDCLQNMNRRTLAIAGRENTFEVTCQWRIRVGGHRGPESILLPAFDSLGIPYIPSSTLRGVARNQAIRSFMNAENLRWKEAEKRVAPYFGSIDSDRVGERVGKVIFLDAYPKPSKTGGLALDMANNIWQWSDRALTYSPNPNPFFSLKASEFLIGLRPLPGYEGELKQVKQWLVEGLQAGVGSQVNSGYGGLATKTEQTDSNEFFRVEFALEGQLIHGAQAYTSWQWNSHRKQWNMRGRPIAEPRPIAFKSMMRYWFRAFSLGVLPARDVKVMESKLFGAIEPQARGWLRVRVLEGRVVQKEPRPNAQGKHDSCGEEDGTLTLAFSSEAPVEKHQAIAELSKSLAWLMFHLGGLGQGARRPRYSRKTRSRAPWFRGSSLFALEEGDPFWELPRAPQEFKKIFHARLRDFYKALQELFNFQFNVREPLRVSDVSRGDWTEAIDKNCQIIVCKGEEEFNKPFALSTLHDSQFKIQGNYDGNLCGKVRGGVKPSPVWISDLTYFQVVTVFGASQDPRRQYLKVLRERADRFDSLWPL
ncbi:MAG: RAMP superfamily CRISPR-associated protein [Cyanobacteria bacterium J06642_2]